MRKGSMTLLMLGVAGVVAAGAYLAPSHQELALMQMNDADYGQALEKYQKLQSQGSESINVLVPLMQLYVHYGDMDKAISMLETFVARNPRSVEGYRRLAELYKSSQRIHHYCDALEKLQALSPSAATLTELANTYDFLGRYPEKMQVMAQLMESPGYMPMEDDVMQLATFYRVSGKQELAAHTMTAFIDRRAYKVSVDAVYFAALLLLDNTQEKEAMTLATAYLGPKGKQEDALMLESLFRARGRLEDAYALLSPFLPEISRSPLLLQEVVGIQIAHGQEKEAYNLLIAQQRQGDLPPSLALSLVDLALKFGDVVRAEEVLAHAPLTEASEAMLLHYADMAFLLKRPSMAEGMRQRLGADYLKDFPVLSAVLDVVVHASPQTMAALLALPPESMAEPEQKLVVAAIYLQAGHTGRALALFDAVPVADMLATIDPLQAAYLYLDAGEADKGMQRFAVTQEQPAALQLLLRKAALLLDVGSGKDEAVIVWIKAHPGPEDVDDDAYAVAERYHRTALMVKFAERLYAHEPTPDNRLQLAEALLTAERYPEALTQLQALSSVPGVRKRTLEAVADWLRQSRRDGLTDRSTAALEKFISPAMKYTHMSADEKRNMAYLLKEAGITDKAENLFVELAAGQPFGTPDVTELLAFWGERPSEAAVGWIEHRAMNAYGFEKAQWLGYLNDIGQPQRVVSIVDGMSPPLPQVTLDRYIDALVATHNKKRLSRVLEQEIAQEDRLERLVRLATTARQEDVMDMAERGWRKVYGLDPRNAEAARELGLMAYAASRYSEAQKFLEQYLQATAPHQADYRVNYAYAEILQHKEKKSQAREFYAQAEKQVTELPNKDLSSLLDEARLLYRNNHLQEAIDLYRQLLARNPRNKAVRADFAEMLIESKNYEEASLLLSE